MNEGFAGSIQATRDAPDDLTDRGHALQTVIRRFPPRRFLFLQGVPGRFMHELGLALAARGHGVLRVNFNGGDRLAWPSLPAMDFRGRTAEWPAFLQRLMFDFAPTDMILQGDCRLPHMMAIELANRQGVAVHVFEEGYLRPDWVTLEIGGVNGYSRLPRDWRAYRRLAAQLPALPAATHVPPSVKTRARDCIRYAACCIALGPLYPHYETHRGWTPLHEAAGWVKRAGRARGARRRSGVAMQSAFDARGGFFVLPIQMDNDSQILRHSDLGGMMHAIRLVVASFAQYAPRDAMLAVKEHPLDNGIIDWRKVVRDAARQSGVAERVVLIEACDLQRLLDRARGLVTVNSTSATFALAAGVPVIALGRSVYDLPGLTHQGTLSSFWTDPMPPDPSLFEAFRRVVAHACLIAGDFFTREGVARAVAGAVPRIEAAEDASARAEAAQGAGLRIEAIPRAGRGRVSAVG
jgi:capsular polysaccharide export protein